MSRSVGCIKHKVTVQNLGEMGKITHISGKNANKTISSPASKMGKQYLFGIFCFSKVEEMNLPRGLKMDGN